MRNMIDLHEMMCDKCEPIEFRFITIAPEHKIKSLLVLCSFDFHSIVSNVVITFDILPMDKWGIWSATVKLMNTLTHTFPMNRCKQHVISVINRLNLSKSINLDFQWYFLCSMAKRDSFYFLYCLPNVR